MPRSGLLAWGWLVLTTTECSRPASPDAGQQTSQAELCDRLAGATCELLARCYPAFVGQTPAGCLATERARCEADVQTLAPSFEARRVTIDEAQLARCEQRLRGSACPPTFPPNGPGPAAQPFNDCGLQTGLLVGSEATGQTCTASVECVPGTHCVQESGACRGVCAAASVAGEHCGLGCASGLRCAGDVCVATGQLGEPCASSAECDDALICLGTCRPRRQLHESCAFDQHRPSQCAPGLACDVTPLVAGASGTCVLPRAAGEPCAFHWSCAEGLICADLDWSGFPSSAPPPGTCRQPDGAGFNCPATVYERFVGTQCAAGLRCDPDTRTCAPRPQLGQPCAPSRADCDGVGVSCQPTGGTDRGLCTGPADQGARCAFVIDRSRTVTIPCNGGFCDAESTLRCQPPTRPLGALCDEPGQCASGRCAVQQDATRRCAQGC